MNKPSPNFWLALCLLFCWTFPTPSNVLATEVPPIYKQLDTASSTASRVKLLNRAAFEYISVDLDSSYKWNAMAMDLSLQDRPSKNLSSSYGTRAILHTISGNYAEAHHDHMQSLAIKEELKDTLGMARTFSNLSILYQELGAFDQALQFQLQARDHFADFKDTLGLGKSYLSIGDNYREMSQLDSARTYILKGIEWLRMAGDLRFQASGMCTMGIMAEESGDTAAAFGYYQEARAIYLGNDLEQGMGRLKGHLGYLELRKGNPGLALQYFNAADSIFARIGEARAYLEIRMAIGDACLQMGDQRAAMENYRFVADSARQMGSIIVQYGAAEKLAEALAESGDFEAAYAQRLVYEALEDSIYSIESERALLQASTRYEVGKREQEITILGQEAEIQGLKLTRSRSLLGLATGIGIAVLAILALTVVRNKHRRNREQVERLALEHKLLRTQMNPHFLFNALTAIQNFIHDQAPEKAASYLGQFAQLMRMTLDNSRLESIPLEQEIEGLRYYLRLQQLRFPGKFDFEVTLGPEVENGWIDLPPMLAQPFIENAVEHGFKDMAAGGRIEILYAREGEHLLLEVRDNGAGRKEAGRQNKSHRSWATEITEQRLKLLSGGAGRIKIVDLGEENPGQRGTAVTLLLPWNLEWNT